MSRPESRVLNLSGGTVSGLEEAREPAEAFAFEFDQAGAVAAVKLADDWAKFVEVEEFGFALLYTYAEQHAQALPQITAAIEEVSHRFNDGGRLVYVGAGTSGRLGVLDASECPPTYNTRPEQVVGLISDGDHALRNATEGAEDDAALGASCSARRGWAHARLAVGP